MVALWVAVLGLAATWWVALALGLPALACLLLARRARVLVWLDGDKLTVRPGLGPTKTLMLRSARSTVGEGPYREGDVGAVNRSELAIVEQAAITGPVFAENTPLTRGIGSVLRMLHVVIAPRSGMDLSLQDEAMGKFSVLSESGEAHHFVVPGEGRANEARLAELQRALNPDAGDDGSDTP